MKKWSAFCCVRVLSSSQCLEMLDCGSGVTWLTFVHLMWHRTVKEFSWVVSLFDGHLDIICDSDFQPMNSFQDTAECENRPVFPNFLLFTYAKGCLFIDLWHESPCWLHVCCACDEMNRNIVPLLFAGTSLKRRAMTSTLASFFRKSSTTLTCCQCGREKLLVKWSEIREVEMYSVSFCWRILNVRDEKRVVRHFLRDFWYYLPFLPCRQLVWLAVSRFVVSQNVVFVEMNFELSDRIHASVD